MPHFIIIEDDPAAYKLKYIIQQTHPKVWSQTWIAIPYLIAYIL